MNSRNTIFIIAMAGALAAGTLFLASILFNDFNVWIASLTTAHKKLLPSIFAAVSAGFICLGAFLRRNKNRSEEER